MIAWTHFSNSLAHLHSSCPGCEAAMALLQRMIWWVGEFDHTQNILRERQTEETDREERDGREQNGGRKGQKAAGFFSVLWGGYAKNEF